MNTVRYDAIVIGSGISGGWVAKELCERGLRTLVLERGRDVRHIKDYPTMTLRPWEMDLRGSNPRAWEQQNPLIAKAAGYDFTTRHFFVKDSDHPYVQEKPFNWVRGYQVGGKSLIWGRATSRWAPTDFTAPERYGYGIAWPFGYEDIAPWYSHVEKFIGVTGSREGIETMPDGEFLPPYELNCVEQHLRKVLREKFNRHYVVGRWAHLSEAKEVHRQQGRSECRNRDLCMRGCPYGGYFSSNSSTLPWAERTGKLTIRPHSVVHSIVHDPRSGLASGVKVIDSETHEMMEFQARVIFVNASTMNTNLVLLNSRSERFPRGLGNDNGLLGRHVCFHNYRAGVWGVIDGFEDHYYAAKRPIENVIPNYRNVHRQDTDFVGGYTIYSGAGRETRNDEGIAIRVGPGFKSAVSQPGRWTAYMYMQGETIPKYESHVRLSPDQTDAWGIPQLVFSVGYDDNDERMVADFLRESQAMMKAAGFRDLVTWDNHQAPGLDIHEMGGVRLGKDPATSLLNAHNQLHACPNVFVTDGSSMASTGNQSPSILYMAMSARAANFAADELQRHGRLG